MLWLICSCKSVQGKESEKEPREREGRRAGGGGGAAGGAGGQVINNSRDHHNGQRGPFCSAHGAPCEALAHSCFRLLSIITWDVPEGAESSVVVINASPATIFRLSNKKLELKETNPWSRFHDLSAAVSLSSFSLTILNASDPSQSLICYHLLWHF